MAAGFVVDMQTKHGDAEGNWDRCFQHSTQKVTTEEHGARAEATGKTRTSTTRAPAQSAGTPNS